MSTIVVNISEVTLRRPRLILTEKVTVLPVYRLGRLLKPDTQSISALPSLVGKRSEYCVDGLGHR